MSPRTPSLLLACLILLLACHAAPAQDSVAEKKPRGVPTSDQRMTNAWFAAGRNSVAQARRFVGDEGRAKNVILFIGDGMGIATVTAARILEGQKRGESGEENRLAFETLPHVAFSKTYNTDAQVSDSPSTMTAIVSGVKTKTGVVGVDERIRRGDHESVDAARVLTIIEEAEDRGLATGIVTTTSISHATPAACYAHTPLRTWEDDSRMSASAREAGFSDIARQLVEFEHGDGIEVALGGGRSHFMPKGTRDPEDWQKGGERLDGRDLTREWIEAHEASAYVWNREQLRAINLGKTSHLLGLFDPDDMKFEADRGKDAGGEPSLAEMTGIAIDLLSKDPDGFFLMVEAGRIDHGHHAGNAYRALTETIELSNAVAVALRKTNAKDTLIVVTADHSHTLTISGYPQRGNPILGKVAGFDWDTERDDQVALDDEGRPYTTLSYANGPGYVGKKDPPNLSEVDTEDPDYLQRATIPMKTETHAGEDVPIYAGGPRAALLHGVQEQNYIYHAMVEALGWTREGIPVH